MPQLESKTVLGLLLLLACIIGLAIFGKLTAEAVDALKWVGGTYMAVRTAANVTENLKK
jgi:threonine/homoserine/homoserine lactone efflux protein